LVLFIVKRYISLRYIKINFLKKNIRVADKKIKKLDIGQGYSLFFQA